MRQATFVTTDPDEAHEFLRSAYVDNTMRITGDREHFRMWHDHRDTGRFSIATLDHTMAVEHVAEPLGYLLVARVLDGDLERTADGSTLRAGQGDVFLVARPDQPYTIRWNHMRMQLFRIDTALVGELTGEPGVPTFTGLSPVSSDAARYCASVLDFLTDDLLANDTAVGSSLVVGSAARLLAAAVLTTFPHESDDTAAGTPPAAFRKALRFIDDEAHRDIAIADIAEAAHVTPRAVQLAFRNNLDTTPTTYLRRVRLARVHDDLLAADPARGATVTEIATRWGFYHPGRFAAAYRAAYGCSPRDTLRA